MSVTEDDPPELWRWVVGFEGLYIVSNTGRVMSVPSMQVRRGADYYKPGKEVKHHDNGRGYRVISLYKDGVQHQTTVHRLVATAFIPNPENLPEINHRDGDKANNMVQNLEWASKSQNMQHAVNELDALGFNRKFTEEQIVAIRNDSRSEGSIAADYGVNQTAINAIRQGKTYKRFGGPTGRIGRARQRKLTADQVRVIRSSTRTNVDLAQEYGVADSTICKIRKRQRYKEVTDD